MKDLLILAYSTVCQICSFGPMTPLPGEGVFVNLSLVNNKNSRYRPAL